MSATKIAFLYSEIAGYFLACAKTLATKAEVLIVRWPTNDEAPFEFKEEKQLKIINKADYSTLELQGIINAFDPNTVVCSGWMDKDYLKIVKSLDQKVNRVLSLDNHWKGNLKQQIATFVSPFYLKKIFTHAWVPGKPQEKFAKKLGFKGKTLLGFYCADNFLFQNQYKATFTEKKEKFPKRFLYVARYVSHKGIFELWRAFVSLQKEYPNEWELWCLGTGEEWDNRIEHEKIKHFGFVQPKEMNPIIKETGVYILPSKFEPWGVSVQEFAISGYPLLLSDEIGSKEFFLNENGEAFQAGNENEIKRAMLKIINTDSADLIKMGEKSNAVGMSYTMEMWAEKILNL